MKKLYHTSVFVPEHIFINATCAHYTSLVWSGHAQRALLDDRYGKLPASSIPLSFNGPDWELIEVETFNGSIKKAVYRRPIDAHRSLVLVICPDGPCCGFVKTCWINLNSDKHPTLDKSKYATS